VASALTNRPAPTFSATGSTPRSRNPAMMPAGVPDHVAALAGFAPGNATPIRRMHRMLSLAPSTGAPLGCRAVEQDKAPRRTDGDSEIPRSTRSVGGAVVWSFVMNAARLASTLGTAFILARLLGPEAFGTVALALIFITLVQLLVQQGMIPAVVQRPGLTWRHLDSAFWLSMTISVILTAFSLVVSPWWADLNGTPEARNAIWVLSSMVLLKGLVVVQEAYLQRALRYRELALRTTVASVAGAIVGIAWALVQPSIWALVAQQVVSAAVGTVVIWTVVDWRPRWRCRAQDVRDLLGFAVKSTMSSLGVFVNTRVDAVLIGVFFGATAIGLYQLSFRLMHSAIETVVYPIAGVALADLSRQHGDRERMTSRYLSLVGTATVIGAPVMATIFACAGPLMTMVGPEWAAAAPALRLLCVVGIVTIVGMINSPALQASGHPGAQAGIVWLGAAVSATTFAVAGALLSDNSTADQVLGMAASRAVIYVVLLLPISQALVSRHVGASVSRFLGTIAVPVVISAGAAGLGLLVQTPLRALDAPNIVVLSVAGALTLLTATASLLFLDVNARHVARRISGRLGLNGRLARRSG